MVACLFDGLFLLIFFLNSARWPWFLCGLFFRGEPDLDFDALLFDLFLFVFSSVGGPRGVSCKSSHWSFSKFEIGYHSLIFFSKTFDSKSSISRLDLPPLAPVVLFPNVFCVHPNALLICSSSLDFIWKRDGCWSSANASGAGITSWFSVEKGAFVPPVCLSFLMYDGM